MLSRLIPKPSHFRLVTLISSKSHSRQRPPQYHNFNTLFRFLSTNRSDDDNGRDTSLNDLWRFSQESDAKFDSLFSKNLGSVSGITEGQSPAGQEEEQSWLKAKDVEESDVFGGIEKEIGVESSGEGWANLEGDKPWSFAEEDKADMFDFRQVAQDVGETKTEVDESESDSIEDPEELKEYEEELTAILKGPDLAFGDLIAASGITDAMLDSLIALKDFEGVEGLPPLSEIEDMRYEKNTRRSSRADMERLKQEEEAKARVRQVDEKGRAYGTGRRKCSIARVWVQPGDGKFAINGKQFDVYFPMLDHRAALLRPFSETKTLGLWDINCTVKGGGVSGQVGAIQLGISRALQNWEPELRPPLRSAGFLTRDPRVVERKKPGKAKARKSFQWVKR